jgi:hypothetical protein
MATLTYGRSSSPEPSPRRGVLLRLLDTLAEQHMQHAHRQINRRQLRKATITSVTQPSSANVRSSTNPCDR